MSTNILMMKFVSKMHFRTGQNEIRGENKNSIEELYRKIERNEWNSMVKQKTTEGSFQIS